LTVLGFRIVPLITSSRPLNRFSKSQNITPSLQIVGKRVSRFFKFDFNSLISCNQLMTPYLSSTEEHSIDGLKFSLLYSKLKLLLIKRLRNMWCSRFNFPFDEILQFIDVLLKPIDFAIRKVGKTWIFLYWS